MPKVFVSHSAKDSGFVKQLATDLKDAGIAVWFDQWEIKVGDSIIEKINEGISSSDYLIVVLSKSSTTSKWVREELSAAKTIEIDKRGVFILPVLLETCDIPPMIASKRYADFRVSYEKGLTGLLDVFGLTSVHTTDAERYRKLDDEWHKRVMQVQKRINHIIRLEPGKKDTEYFTTDAYSEENRTRLREELCDILDVYRALRPLEKSKRLSESLDGSAYFLSVLARAHDIQLQTLEFRYTSLRSVGLGVYLALGCTQATCTMDEESIWTFRKAIRIAMEIKRPWEDALFTLTYNLTRHISFLNLPEEDDIAVKMLVFDDPAYGKDRYNKILRCYRSALEKELGWDISNDPDDRVSYSNLMEAVGLWREAFPYFSKATKDFPEEKELKDRYEKIKNVIRMHDSSDTGTVTVSGFTLHQVPPFFLRERPIL